MKVKIKRLHPDAVIPFKAYPSDCVAVSEEEIAPNVWRYGLGFALQIERDWETILNGYDVNEYKSFFDSRIRVNLSNSPIILSIDFRSRSSIWKTGMVLSNSLGTVDKNFTGEISAVFYHVLPNMPRYKVGDRVCQCKIGATFPMDFIEVEELDARDRSTNGYGSSGR